MFEIQISASDNNRETPAIANYFYPPDSAIFSATGLPRDGSHTTSFCPFVVFWRKCNVQVLPQSYITLIVACDDRWRVFASFFFCMPELYIFIMWQRIKSLFSVKPNNKYESCIYLFLERNCLPFMKKQKTFILLLVYR